MCGGNEMTNNLGVCIRSLRKSKKITLVQMAEKTGLSQPYLSQIENNKKGTPSPELLRTISEALEVDYFELMVQAGYLSTEEANNRKKIVEESLNNKREIQRFLDENEKKMEETQQEDVSFVLDNAKHYKGHTMTDNDKALIRTFLDALFMDRD